MLERLKDPHHLALGALYLALALLWGLLLPIHEAPDEQNHYRYMVFLKDQGRLPQQWPAPPEVPGEGHQPPLYYALGALALKVAAPDAAFKEAPRRETDFDRQAVYFEHGPEEGRLRFEGPAWPPHLLRMLQLLLLLPAVLLMAMTVERILPGPAGRSAVVLLALNPGFLFLSGALNNDLMAFALATALMAGVLGALQKGRLGPRDALYWGFLCGLGALSKLTVLGVIPAALWGLWRLDRRGFTRQAFLLGAAALVLCGWWFLRNLGLYGDLTGWDVIVRDCPQCIQPKDPWQFKTWWYLLKVNVDTFWSVFGWMTWRAPVAVTAVFAGLMASALAGLALVRRPSPVAPGVLVLCGLALAGVGAIVLRHNLFFHPPHGRYFFAALLPLAVLLGSGWQRLFRVPAFAPWLALAAMALLNLWLLLTRLIPLYS